jgi:hypothetical protein
MKKIVLIYGLISGGILGAMLLSTMSLYESGTLNLDNGELVGYSTMVISLSLIFFGVKNLRDNHYGGAITFGKATQAGLLITLVASVIYAGAWEISYSRNGNEFMKKMQAHYFEKLKGEGLSETELKAKQESIKTMMEYYKNPVVRFGITITEVMPVGILLSLISAGLLRKKEFLSATNTQTVTN